MIDRDLIRPAAEFLTLEPVAQQIQKLMAYNLFSKWTNAETIEEREAVYIQVENLNEFFESLTEVVNDALDLEADPNPQP